MKRSRPFAFAIVASLAALGAGIYCKTQGNAAFNARFGAADFQAAFTAPQTALRLLPFTLSPPLLPRVRNRPEPVPP